MEQFSIILLMVLCTSILSAQENFNTQGHRGCRGLMPENTISAMKKALDLGVQTLELDVVISKDKKVVVSHDSYMSADFMLKPSGDTITDQEQNNLILYAMPYSEIRKFDAGSRHNIRFPRQENFKTYKPLLTELIDAIEQYVKENKLPHPSFNIEIKSDPRTDGIEQPEPQEFVDLVLRVCKDRNITGRMNIQSFDIRPLQLIHKQHPSIKLSYLTENLNPVSENLQSLGFTPDFYSPYYKAVNAEAVKFCREKGMKIIPWTVNNREEIKALMAIGVDGIITDYPDLFK